MEGHVLYSQILEFLEVFPIFNQSLGMKLIHTSSGRPRANPLRRRINTEIKYIIRELQESHSFINTQNIHKNVSIIFLYIHPLDILQINFNLVETYL